MEPLAVTATDLPGLRILTLDPFGPLIASDRDAPDYIGECFSQRAGMIVIPVSRLVPDFFALHTRIAGEVIQKFINYDIRVTVLGDISMYVDQSSALRAFVRESNRGDWVWFLQDRAELEQRLMNAAQGRGL